MERLVPLGAVGELEEAGESAPVLIGVREDGILEVDAMGEDVIILIHPASDMIRDQTEQRNKNPLEMWCRKKKSLTRAA